MSHYPLMQNESETLQAASGRPLSEVTLDALDSSPQPGGQVNRFKAALSGDPFISGNLQKTNGVQLLSLSPPQIDVLGRNQYVKFSLQCSFGEKVR